MSDLKVAFDSSILAPAVGGVSRYARGLLHGLAHVAPDEGIELITVDVPASHPGLREAANISLRTPWFMRVPLLRRIPIRAGLEQRSRSGRLEKLVQCAVYHHSGVQPFFPPSARSVLTLHDLTAIQHPEWHTIETVRYGRLEDRLIREGSRVITSSEWTASRVVGHFGFEREGRVWCIGGAADDLFTPGTADPEALRSRDLEPDGFLLVVGNLEPRKNIRFILDIHGRAVRRGLDLPLVLAGAAGWGEALPETSESVRIMRDVDDALLLDLYRGSRAVLLPSLDEGLGLVALEAMACGAALIASSAGALPGTVGDGGLLLPPDSHPEWLEVLLSLGEADGLHQELRRRSQAFPRPRWDDVARRLCRAYLEIAEVVEQ